MSPTQIPHVARRPHVVCNNKDMMILSIRNKTSKFIQHAVVAEQPPARQTDGRTDWLWLSQAACLPDARAIAFPCLLAEICKVPVSDSDRPTEAPRSSASERERRRRRGGNREELMGAHVRVRARVPSRRGCCRHRGIAFRSERHLHHCP